MCRERRPATRVSCELGLDTNRNAKNSDSHTKKKINWDLGSRTRIDFDSARFKVIRDKLLQQTNCTFSAWKSVKIPRVGERFVALTFSRSERYQNRKLTAKLKTLFCVFAELVWVLLRMTWFSGEFSMRHSSSRYFELASPCYLIDFKAPIKKNRSMTQFDWSSLSACDMLCLK